MSKIANGKDIPLNKRMGSIPDVSGALTDYYQSMTFGLITKKTVGFQELEAETPINFQGIMQPFTDRQLYLKPEGQRAWSWFLLHADPTLELEVDAVVIYAGIQTRVMAKKDYRLYGYIEYHLVQDWKGAGP